MKRLLLAYILLSFLSICNSQTQKTEIQYRPDRHQIHQTRNNGANESAKYVFVREIFDTLF